MIRGGDGMVGSHPLGIIWCIGWYRYSGGVGIESWDLVWRPGVPLECL